MIFTHQGTAFGIQRDNWANTVQCINQLYLPISSPCMHGLQSMVRVHSLKINLSDLVLYLYFAWLVCVGKYDSFPGRLLYNKR